MICKGCGKVLDDGFLFCDACGTKVEAEAPVEATPVVETNEPVVEMTQIMPESEPAEEPMTVVPEEAQAEPSQAEQIIAEGGFVQQAAEPVAEPQPVFEAQPQQYAQPAFEQQPQQYTQPVPEPQPQQFVQPAPVKKGGSKALTIVLSCVAGVCLAAAIVFVILWIGADKQTKNLKAQNEVLTQSNTELQNQVEIANESASNAQSNADYYSDMYENLSDNYNELYEEYLNIESQCNNQLDQIDAMNTESASLADDLEALNVLKEFTSGNYYDDFYGSKDVMVLRVGESADVNITLNYDASTVYWDISDSFPISTQYGDWTGYTFPLTVTGDYAGYSILTFTNSVNSESFEVLVIVNE